MQNYSINCLQKELWMQNFSTKLTTHLFKKYNVKAIDAQLIIEDEWDYIEEEYYNSSTVESVAKDLIEMYMVA
jgi:hypothetical protein